MALNMVKRLFINVENETNYWANLQTYVHFQYCEGLKNLQINVNLIFDPMHSVC